MSERTAASLARIDEWLTQVKTLPPSPSQKQLIDEAEALQRAVSAFHMEAIRFRMHAVDRLVAAAGDGETRRLFDAVRQALEAAGFHTRSHSAP